MWYDNEAFSGHLKSNYWSTNNICTKVTNSAGLFFRVSDNMKVEIVPGRWNFISNSIEIYFFPVTVKAKFSDKYRLFRALQAVHPDSWLLFGNAKNSMVLGGPSLKEVLDRIDYDTGYFNYTFLGKGKNEVYMIQLVEFLSIPCGLLRESFEKTNGN